MKKQGIALVLICIGFIFIQSLLPQNKSAQESLWITEQVINPILSKFGIVANKEVVRKIAHAVEFCVLSFIITLQWKKPLRSFYSGFTLAFLDESLQCLTGRGTSVTDIWIDLIGVGIGITVYSLIKLIKGKEQKKS